MNGLTWLHLSDWHQRGPDFDRQVVCDALLADLSDRARLDTTLAEAKDRYLSTLGMIDDFGGYALV